MIKRDFYYPAPLVVTTFAGAAFLPFVYIICLMAGGTNGLQFIVVGVAAVAQTARNLHVRAYQGEICLIAMIEFRVRPVLRIMAGVALPAMPPVVVIVILVTGITV